MGDKLLRDRARRLRKEMTDAERALWAKIGQRQIDGFQFRRQFPLGQYIVDFVCFERQLVIEVDGGQHTEQKCYDDRRTAWLENQGFQVLRFWNNEVLTELEVVLETIFSALRTMRARSTPFTSVSSKRP
jgi:very-short-patch-repair endonuclease